MAVDVLLFTGLSSFYTEVTDIEDDEPSYEIAMRPSGTYRIATYLREKYNLDVEVVDFLHSWRYEELKEIVDSRVGPNTRMVGVGGIFYLGTPVIKKIFEYVKTSYPHVTTAAGSQSLWSIATIPNIDYYVVGYGELGISAILEGNPKYSLVSPVAHAPKIPIIDCFEIKEYNAYPWPDLGIDYEDRDFINSHETLSFETSRGCIFQCAFCNFPILGVKHDYTRSAESFKTDLIRNYEKWGTTNYIITDETFNDSVEKVRKYADVVQELPFEVDFTGYIRADLMTQRPHDLDELIRMRFNGHFYGIESTNRESAKAIGKGGDPKKILEGILHAKERFLKETGHYKGELGFIWGLPGETPETLQWTFDWLDKNWIGEASSWYPLGIPKEGNSLIRSNVIGRNLEKFGYKSLQPIELSQVGDQLDYIFEDPEISDYIKNKIKQDMPDLNSPAAHFVVQWKNEHFDSISAFVGVQQNFFGHKRFLDRGINAFNQSNWTACGYTKDEIRGSYHDLPSVMHPPLEERRAVIESYKQKKLSCVS